LLLSFSSDATESVPDPYFGDAGQGFEKVLDLVENACQHLLEQLQQELANTKVEH
jgi:protein-tyrosine phosphatase